MCKRKAVLESSGILLKRISILESIYGKVRRAYFRIFLATNKSFVKYTFHTCHSSQNYVEKMLLVILAIVVYDLIKCAGLIFEDVDI